MLLPRCTLYIYKIVFSLLSSQFPPLCHSLSIKLCVYWHQNCFILFQFVAVPETHAHAVTTLMPTVALFLPRLASSLLQFRRHTKCAHWHLHTLSHLYQFTLTRCCCLSLLPVFLKAADMVADGFVWFGGPMRNKHSQAFAFKSMPDWLVNFLCFWSKHLLARFLATILFPTFIWWFMIFDCKVKGF